MSLLLLLLAAAQQPGESCPAGRAAPPAALAGWNTQAPFTAAADVHAAGEVVPGKAVRLRLHPSAHVKLATGRLEATPGGSYAGLARFEVARAGRYRVALGGGAWIDVVANGKPLTSLAHGHGPACSGIRKMVDFDLKPGRYLIQLKDAKSAEFGLMVARL